MTGTKTLWILAGLLLLARLSAAAQVRVTPVGHAPHFITVQRGEAQDSSVRLVFPQAEKATDIDITRRIRQAILDEESLSAYAHNVQILVRNGQVTLKGPVRTPEEKTTVEEKASGVVGKENVKSEVEVSPGRMR